ncbi:dihydroorotase [Leeuwenhoekiella aestuarii]|uniref:Dihydroorotase n=1 Tax=Leeuwenhoekiella aestuarii TaxID=2249426 RepID=A0A4Q0NZI0_9FLAO|nr:amidohydrolase/deacetylase family metallohydrolase [Leeuwenhoekiella aestuarii]RXG18380.1 dihydroorotase [Leeuwenhoekiella aestuarii]RXG19685.1 dihydroorotase [Leeuwenhoekiella aestuarii]
MLNKKLLIKIVLVCILGNYNTVLSQQYDLILKGGSVINPKDGKRASIYDIAVLNDTIVAIDKKIADSKGKKVVDLKGYYVTPGLIDLHSHHFFGTKENHYLNEGFHAVAPDGFTFRSGVTTVVDAGSPGWKNFEIYKNTIIKHSKTRILSLLNIVGEGMRGGVWEQNLNDMDAKMTALTIQQNPELVGVKVAHYSGEEWTPIERAVEAGELANVPVMIDFGGHQPPLSLTKLLIEELRPGDIFTHMYANLSSVRMTILDPDTKKLYDYAVKGRERGIIFDVGHGGGSFAFAQAVPAMSLGFYPDTISTDLHTDSMNAGMKDLLNIMSKFLNLDMPFEAIIDATTWRPAQVIQRPELGKLEVGGVADIAVLSIQKGDFGFVDSAGMKMKGDEKIQCEMTIRAGEIVYDLNGLASELWNQTAQ